MSFIVPFIPYIFFARLYDDLFEILLEGDSQTTQQILSLPSSTNLLVFYIIYFFVEEAVCFGLGVLQNWRFLASFGEFLVYNFIFSLSLEPVC